MLSKCRVKSIPILLRSVKLPCRTLCSAIQESCDKPNYPPIEEITDEYKKLAAKKRLHEKYRKLKTVEEKLFALNLPRYWGWETTIINEGNIPYNFINFVKYATRTHLVKSDRVPVTNCASEDDINNLLDIVKPQIQRAILFEEFDVRHNEAEQPDLSDIKIRDIKTKSLIEQVNRVLMNNLGKYTPHILHSEVDYDPRLEAFWKVGGFHQSIDEHARRTEELERDDIPFEGHDDKDFANRPVEHWFQYFGRVLLQLRSNLPLKAVSDQLEPLSAGEIQKLVSGAHGKYSPAFYGLEEKRRFGTTIPGFWPGTESEYGLLSYHSRNHLYGRPPHFGDDEHEDAVHSQAMLAGHASCHGQASYQGFSTFNEVTYPLISQHVITDGRQFSFYVYQLNTTLMHADYIDTNPRANVCYAMPTLQLYKEISGNQFIGWDDSALRMLIAFYMNKPVQRDYDMKPNVDKSETYVKDITDIDERRTWLHNEFRFMFSNRPRRQLPYEIFDWEWIYKIKFMTRPFDRRIRPFEKWEHPPTQRTYKDYLPKYIPKTMRYPDNPSQENYNTYFPDAFPEKDDDVKKL